MKHNYDYYELNDEQFLRSIEFHSKIVKNYLEKLIYDFIPFYISKGFKTKAIFDNNFERIVNTSLEVFGSYQFRNNINYNRVKNILKNKYQITILKDYPIKIT